MGQSVSRWVVVAAAAMIALAVAPTSAAAGGNELGDLVEYELTFPVEGDHYFSDWFWSRRSHGIHHAQDIIAEKMTPVVAAADGTISMVNWSTTSYRNPSRCCSLVLAHDDGWETQYIHLNNDTPGSDDGKGWGIADGIAPGVHVTAGTLIGWLGDSGNAEDTSPHLHFELIDPSGIIVNPFNALADAGGNWLGWGPADPLLNSSRVLTVGDRGADVRRLQQLLNQIGIAAGPADAIFGPLTLAAVRGLQIDAGITVDGLVGRATRAAVDDRYDPDPPPPNRILRRGDRGQDVVRLQRLLAAAGHDAGRADGIFGSRTASAVIAFQETEGLAVDGLVGPITKERLGF